MKIKPLPPVEYLEECFACDFNAGILTWKARPREHFKTVGAWKTWNAKFACKAAGWLRQKGGYLSTAISYSLYPTHRIIWKLATGFDPADQIDHINGIKSDNRLCNLREASRSQNCRNSPVRTTNTLQVKGVRRLVSGNFHVRVRSGNSIITVGTFPTLEEAQAAYEKAARELHGEFFHGPPVVE